MLRDALGIKVEWYYMKRKKNIFFVKQRDKRGRQVRLVREPFILLIQAALVFSSLYYYSAHFSAHSIFSELSCKPFSCFLINKILQNKCMSIDSSCERCEWNLLFCKQCIWNILFDNPYELIWSVLAWMHLMLQSRLTITLSDPDLEYFPNTKR